MRAIRQREFWLCNFIDFQKTFDTDDYNVFIQKLI